ncbi:MAG: DUF3078 domain-containing protein [Saprospiraceae bacterium]|nr:DUF3078 domain-containing protein [Saprospiraceae bacterium]
MIKYICLLLGVIISFQNPVLAQEEQPTENKTWKFGGGIGLDFAQLLLINPRVGAGENRLGLGGNITAFAKYKKGRASWDNTASFQFGVQRLGRGKKPFQKAIDELRLSSLFAYELRPENPFAYAFDLTFLSQVTPTYEGNYLSHQPGTSPSHPISQFLAPATTAVSPGIAYKPQKGALKGLAVLLSPASLKLITVANDSIAMLGNTDRTASLHGNPFGKYATEDDFRKVWSMRPTGLTADSTYYAKTAIHLGAMLKATYAGKFLKYKEGDKDKHRLSFSTGLTLYSNYLRDPQFIDVEWVTTTDLYIFKGLSISLGTILFYDHDVLVQIDADNDLTTGVNGYEETGRRVSFTQSLLIKYNFLF